MTWFRTSHLAKLKSPETPRLQNDLESSFHTLYKARILTVAANIFLNQFGILGPQRLGF